jgi:hypothetical protein
VIIIDNIVTITIANTITMTIAIFRICPGVNAHTYTYN